MYCSQCGSKLSLEAEVCSSCGMAINENKTSKNNLIGYSSKINDSAFKSYLGKNKKWSLYFSLIISIAAVVGLSIYGDLGNTMDNPQALLVGLAVGSIFIFISLIQNFRQNRSRTWEGQVVDKKQKEKRDEKKGYYGEKYIQYIIYIKDDKGKTHKISRREDDIFYNYYKIGDKVKHHAGFNTYEKYDKSTDSIILCNACGNFNDIKNDRCQICRCPLLK